MPSHSLLLNFQDEMHLEDQWGVSGTHYEKTLNIWLEKLDQNMDLILPIMKATYGDKVVEYNYFNFKFNLFTVEKMVA